MFSGEGEIRCVRRKVLLEELERELPSGTIRYSSKVVSIEDESRLLKLVHLADGTVIKTKVKIYGTVRNHPRSFFLVSTLLSHIFYDCIALLMSRC